MIRARMVLISSIHMYIVMISRILNMRIDIIIPIIIVSIPLAISIVIIMTGCPLISILVEVHSTLRALRRKVLTVTGGVDRVFSLYRGAHGGSSSREIALSSTGR